MPPNEINPDEVKAAPSVPQAASAPAPTVAPQVKPPTTGATQSQAPAKIKEFVFDVTVAQAAIDKAREELKKVSGKPGHNPFFKLANLEKLENKMKGSANPANPKPADRSEVLFHEIITFNYKDTVVVPKNVGRRGIEAQPARQSSAPQGPTTGPSGVARTIEV